MKPKTEKPIKTTMSLEEFAKVNGLYYNAEQASKVAVARSVLNIAGERVRFYRRTVLGTCQTIIAGGAVSRIFRKDENIGGDIDVYSDWGRLIFSEIARGDVAPVRNQRVGPYTNSAMVWGGLYNFIIGVSTGDPEIILSTFDFNLVRLAIDVDDGALYYAPEALEDLRSGTLTTANTHWNEITDAEYPYLRKLRLEKYAKMGYYPSFDAMLDSEPLASVSDSYVNKLEDGVSKDTLEEIMYSSLPRLQGYINEVVDEKLNRNAAFNFRATRDPSAWTTVYVDLEARPTPVGHNHTYAYPRAMSMSTLRAAEAPTLAEREPPVNATPQINPGLRDNLPTYTGWGIRSNAVQSQE